jgi:hypothetical protein
MRCLLRFFRRRRGPTREALAARAAAKASMAQANRDCAEAMMLRAEARQITERLREHNEANRYDEWLKGVLDK